LPATVDLGPVHSVKQKITETSEFLIWLDPADDRDAASCTQQDVDEWLDAGPSTRDRDPDRDPDLLRHRPRDRPQPQRADSIPPGQDDCSPNVAGGHETEAEVSTRASTHQTSTQHALSCS
jgi:hypothetical protein